MSKIGTIYLKSVMPGNHMKVFNENKGKFILGEFVEGKMNGNGTL